MANSLLRISLIISLIGIFILLLISILVEPRLTSINELKYNLLNQNIKIKGEIINIHSYEKSNFQVISIKDSTGEIQVTINEILKLNKSQEIIVIGKVSEYKNSLQIQAEKITLL